VSNGQTQTSKLPNWAEEIARQIYSQKPAQQGVCLIVGAADTGKTSLAMALAALAAQHRSVGIVDADIGQSHIGPPAAVGWAVIKDRQADFSQLAAAGISFVGDITPMRHLLQLTAAIMQCVRRACETAKFVIIDTPGFVYGSAAAALWWTVQRILQPNLIVAVQRSCELKDILAGLWPAGAEIKMVECPSWIPVKSPQDRRSYRQSVFDGYFRNSRLYNISLNETAVPSSWNIGRDIPAGQLVGLRNQEGVDIAVGVVAQKSTDEDIIVVRAPQMDVQQVCCVVVGDISVDIESGQDGRSSY
jgi:polynucleotide 5'-hydroxyl-kinase GRC3/NOL9